MTPQRWQRSRKAGAKQPESCKYLGRPNKWSNLAMVGATDYRTGKPYTQETAVEEFRRNIESLIKRMGEDKFIKVYLLPLVKYKYLSCFCPLDKPCHVDVWIEYLGKVEFTPGLIQDAMTGMGRLK